MPVVYSTKTGSKGFYPCSRVYQQVLLNAIQQGDYATVQELFQQSHRLVWKINSSGTQYINIYDPTSTMTIEEHNRIANLSGRDVTANLVRQQCGGVQKDRKTTGFVGPQLSSVSRAMNRMQRVQKASYEAAARDGYPIDGFRGLGLYAPSPFTQQQDEKGVYRPSVDSAAYCDVENPCPDNLECENNVCVIPTNRRECPPFQYPVTLDGKEGKFTTLNVSSERTRRVRKYSGFWNQWYDTCIPGENKTTQRWVTDRQLRSYIGLAFDVEQLPVDEWNQRKGESRILYDPSTYAPYFVEKDPDGHLKRYYKIRSAYTPNIPLPPNIQERPKRRRIAEEIEELLGEEEEAEENEEPPLKIRKANEEVEEQEEKEELE